MTVSVRGNRKIHNMHDPRFGIRSFIRDGLLVGFRSGSARFEIHDKFFSARDGSSMYEAWLDAYRYMRKGLAEYMSKNPLPSDGGDNGSIALHVTVHACLRQSGFEQSYDLRVYFVKQRIHAAERTCLHRNIGKRSLDAALREIFTHREKVTGIAFPNAGQMKIYRQRVINKYQQFIEEGKSFPTVDRYKPFYSMS